MHINTKPVLPGRKPLLLLTGAFGAGKSTLAEALAERGKCARVVTATTREPRHGERDGREYHFFTPEDFRRRMIKQHFVEARQIADAWYGIPRSALVQAGRASSLPLIVIDPDGADAVATKARESVIGPLGGRFDARVIFLRPGSRAIHDRLRERYGSHHPTFHERIMAACAQETRWRKADCVIDSASVEGQIRALDIYLREIGVPTRSPRADQEVARAG